MVAGAVAILVMLFAMKAKFFDIHIIAGARDGLGISLQMLAGAIGGFVFAKISRAKISRAKISQPKPQSDPQQPSEDHPVEYN